MLAVSARHRILLADNRRLAVNQERGVGAGINDGGFTDDNPFKRLQLELATAWNAASFFRGTARARPPSTCSKHCFRNARPGRHEISGTLRSIEAAGLPPPALAARRTCTPLPIPPSRLLTSPHVSVGDRATVFRARYRSLNCRSAQIPGMIAAPRDYSVELLTKTLSLE